ncbi:hypothetical protein FPQ18DRAFT_334010 [Pyronema domesticum]|uniref:Ubiquitin 3 binding protein But2 C-terminal domain-containing protein n=1 Tax=Pyronema omphalodes (strain CBS 100304) TaxID=1076935 RepID=U4LEL9_PYROM|nr:hypothetical protein FPQ18DRAFT_334010 [Pyronema domesticum]CCX09724.1 Protein of unknown function [Pyronema omphalodes CBS 100304]
MKFSLSTFIIATLASVSFAAPLEARQATPTRVNPSVVAKAYESAPTMAVTVDGYGQTSRYGSGSNSVSSLVYFSQPPGSPWSGKRCNLRFSDPVVLSGSKTFAVFEFIPSNGVTFDISKATWNQRTGYRNRELATFKVGEGSDLVYSYPCPTDGKGLNFELTSSNGDSEIQWNSNWNQGLWLQVV